MNRYQLTNVYTAKETCQHCGRAIKSIFVLYDNIEGKDLHVGMKCIQNIMNLNESFAKSLEKELNKYSKLLKKVNEFNVENEVKKMRKQLEKFHNGVITKDNKHLGGQIWDEEKHCHRARTLEEFDADYEKNIKNRTMVYEYDIRDLNEQREILNKLSKKGLINIEA